MSKPHLSPPVRAALVAFILLVGLVLLATLTDPTTHAEDAAQSQEPPIPPADEDPEPGGAGDALPSGNAAQPQEPPARPLDEDPEPGEVGDTLPIAIQPERATSLAIFGGPWLAQGPGPITNGQVENITPDNEVGGAVHVLAAHPANADILYAGGANGGIWKTINATNPQPNWTPQTDDKGSLSLGALEFDPTDASHNTLVAGIGRYSSFGSQGGPRTGLLRTTNGGTTWTEIDGGLAGKNISGVAPRGSTIVVTSNNANGVDVVADVCAKTGIFRSIDGGASFSQVGPPGVAFDLATDSDNNQVLYAGLTHVNYCAGGANGIYRSLDTGATWSKISPAALDALVIDGTTNNIELATSALRIFANIVQNGQTAGIFSGITNYPPDWDLTWTAMDLPLLPFVSTATISNVIPGTPVTIETVSSHDLATGDEVQIKYVGGTTGANGIHTITVNGPNSFLLDGSSDSTIYTGDGIWQKLSGAISTVVPGTPIKIFTASPHKLIEPAPGYPPLTVQITGVGGTTGANGFHPITVTSSTSFLVNDSSDGSAYSGGGSWQRLVGMNPRYKPGGQGGIHASIRIDPTNRSTVYLGGDRQDIANRFVANYIGALDYSGSLFRGDATVAANGNIPSPQWEHLTHLDNIATIPGGGTVSSSAPHADSREMVFDVNGDIIEGDDGGIYRRTSPQDNLGDWKSIIGDLQVTEIHDVAYDSLSNKIISGNQDTGTTFQTPAGGTTWQSLSIADGGDVAVDNIKLAGSQQSVRYSSTQLLGGFKRSVWNSAGDVYTTSFPSLTLTSGVAFSPQFITPLATNNVAGGRLLIGGASGLYESDDEGATIEQISGLVVNSGGDTLDYGAADSAEAIYAAGGDRVFVRTAVGAIIFNTVASEDDVVRGVAMDPDDHSVGFAIDSDQVFMTSNAGVSWTDVTGSGAAGLTDNNLRSIAAGPDRLFVGGGLGVYMMLIDFPGIWYQLGTGLPHAPVWDLDYDETDNVLVAGTLGRGAWMLHPSIAVDPPSLTVKLGENDNTTRPLTFTNDGGLNLHWTIDEDDSACDSPGDVAWLSIAHLSGTTSPLTSSDTVVTLDATGLALGVHSANLCINSDDAFNPVLQVPVTLTVSAPEPLLCNGPAADFEVGLPIGWVVDDDSGGTGIVWTTTADPACDIANLTNGSGDAACVDGSSSPGAWDTGLWAPIDLSGLGSASLDFRGKYNDGLLVNNYFEVDILDGTNWVNLLSWHDDRAAGDFSVDLSAYTGSSVAYVRFHYVGVSRPDAYIQLDDVALTCDTPPSIVVDPPALTAEQGADEIRTRPLTISNNGGIPLNWNIEEDDTNCAFPSDIPWLSVSPLAGATAPAGSSPIDVTFDSTGLGLGDHTANLCINSDDPLNPVLQVPVTLTVNPPELLVCNGPAIAFESGLPTGWPVVDNSGGAGIVWTTTADPACGIANLTNGSGEAACADRDAAGSGAPPYDTELWSNAIDLTGQGSVTLDVKAYYKDFGAGSDSFEVDVWDGAVWTTELSWDENHVPEDFTLDLSAYAGIPDARVRFHYFGSGWDWYAQVDDVTLTCASEGSITIIKDAAPADGADFPFLLQAFQRTWGSSGSSYGQFDAPRGSAVDAAGNVYVADSANDRIQKFDSNGNFMQLLGSSGTGDGQFDGPSGVAVDSAGNIYVAESNNNRIQKFDSSGAFLLKWGSWGTGTNQFKNPSGVAVDSLDNVYVADYGNDRIKKYSSSSTYITNWGGSGDNNGKFSSPSGVALDASDHVYVADSLNNRIQKFDSGGTFISEWGSLGSGNGQFNYPEDVALDSAGNIYVADTSNNRIQTFDSSGTFISKWGSSGSGDGQFAGSLSLAISSAGDVYVSDSGNDRVQKFTSAGFTLDDAVPDDGDSVSDSITFNSVFPSTYRIGESLPAGWALNDIVCSGGSTVTDLANQVVAITIATGDNVTCTFENQRAAITIIKDAAPADGSDFAFATDLLSPGAFLLKWGSQGSADGQFEYPEGVTVDSAGNVFVADRNNHRIQKFDSSGAHLLTLGSLGSADGQFNTPSNLAVDGSGSVYVADAYNHRIQKFDAVGNHLLTFGSNGSGDGQFSFPVDVALDSNGNIFVADISNNRVQKFDSAGNFIIEWGTPGSGDGQFSSPRGVAVDGAGLVFVADYSNNRIQKFDGGGTFISEWGSSGSADGQFNSPVDVAADNSGNIYVADSGNQRIQQFDNSGAFIDKWGSSGSADGQFSAPSGVTVDSAYHVYVADAGNNRIQKFSSDLFALDDGVPDDGDNISDAITFGDAVPGTYVVSEEALPAGWTLVGISCSGGSTVTDLPNQQVSITLAAGEFVTCTFENTKSSITIVKEATPADGTDFAFHTDLFPPQTFLSSWGSLGSGDGQFNHPSGAAVDGAGNIYVGDKNNDRIQKFDSSGAYLLQWGSFGVANGQFIEPAGVAVDGAGNVYVADSGNNRIQKFDEDGLHLLTWGSASTFNSPRGVAVDSAGHVYVADTLNHRIQKFDSSGAYLLQWGTGGNLDEQFIQPEGVAVDRAGNVYVADSGNNRIQTYDSSGAFIRKWGSSGSGDGQFSYPTDVAVDSAGNVTVADHTNNRIQKFDEDGLHLLTWGGPGSGDGQFDWPTAVAVDGTGNVYVADTYHSRMQKFATNLFTLDDALVDDGDLFSNSITFRGMSGGTYVFSETPPAPWGLADIVCSGGSTVPNLPNQQVAITMAAGEEITCTFENKQSTVTIVKEALPADGTDFTFQTDLRPQQSFLTKWGSFGYGNSEFVEIRGVAVDGAGNVYVTDGDTGSNNHRIQKFDSSGAYLLQWGSFGTGDSEFNSATGVAVDSAGNVYVADTLNHRIQKFDSSGAYLLQWGSNGSADGQMLNPEGIAIDAAGNVYVSERFGYRIQKFDSGGNYLLKWDASSAGAPGYFANPFVAVDNSGGVFVADSGNNRLIKYDSSGNYLFQWGTPGSGDDQFASPKGVTVDAAGNVYVADTNNNRIQKFDNSGNFLFKWGSYGSGDEEFQAPRDLAFDGAGDLFVADTGGAGIQKYATDLFTLDDAQIDDSDVFTDTLSFSGMLPGSYVITETLRADWALANIVCSGGSTVPNLPGRSVAVTLAAGEDVTCTFENGGGQEQQVPLGAGWNMISSYLSPSPAAMAAIFPAAGGDLLLCKNGAGQVFWPDMAIDQIGDWDPAAGYQCYAKNAFSISLNGSEIPAGSPMSLPPGWSLAAYWRDLPLAAESALDSCSPELVLAKNGIGEVYWPDYSINQIGSLQPGQGYQMFLANGCTLAYPEN